MPARRRCSTARASRKTTPRVDAYGEVDELNAWLGLARASALDPATRRRARRTSSAICSRSAPSSPIPPTSSRRASPKRCIGDATSRGSKQLIDRLEAELPPLRRFILAGGTPAGAALHVARTVCRRAERRIVALEPPVDPVLLRYVNRLSDLLFVLARVVESSRRASPETEW